MAASFAVGSDVLSYHGPLLYPARIKEVEFKKGAPRYFIHYQGWNAKWDDWVDQDRLLPINEENVARSEELQRTVKENKSKKGKGKRKAEEDEASRKGRRKRKVADEDDSLENDTKENREVVVKIPIQLKQTLLTDWENISKNKKLVTLPAKTSVTQLLQNFAVAIASQRKSQAQVVEEVCAGLKTYFERALGTILLYKFERPQYEDQMESDPAAAAAAAASNNTKCVADIYGPVHLLRLFVKLPELLAQTALFKDEQGTLQTQLADLLKFMVKERETLFPADGWEDTTDKYRARVAALTG
jgi:mortality factor 4-like protein 1